MVLRREAFRSNGLDWNREIVDFRRGARDDYALIGCDIVDVFLQHTTSLALATYLDVSGFQAAERGFGFGGTKAA